jgi:hypothetical protein
MTKWSLVGLFQRFQLIPFTDESFWDFVVAFDQRVVGELRSRNRNVGFGRMAFSRFSPIMTII